MSELKRISGIDIDQDMEYQRREWRIHRVGWGAFGLILLAALLGLFGQGPLSQARAGAPGSAVTLDYQRIDRYQTSTSLRILLDPAATQQGSVRLSLNLDFLDRIQLQRIIPDPESVETGPDAITYVFKISAPAQPAHIRFDYEYDEAGLAHGEMRLAGQPAFQFDSFVFP